MAKPPFPQTEKGATLKSLPHQVSAKGFPLVGEVKEASALWAVTVGEAT